MKTISILVVALMMSAFALQESDPLSEARKLYESAEYARALDTLDNIKPGAVTADEARDRLVYQALCLLALERQPALDAKVQEIVQLDPFFTLGPEVPPRLSTLMADTRDRMRPSLAAAHYRSGKQRFDAGDHAGALHEFTLTLRLLDDAAQDEDDGGSETLADMRVLAEGFRDLARRTLEAPPPPPVASADGVVPPVAIQQDIPAWPAALTSRFAQLNDDALTGILEVVVAKTGDVGTVTLVKRIHPTYDALLVAAAKHWKYQPATLNGEPIEFVKRLNVKVSAR